MSFRQMSHQNGSLVVILTILPQWRDQPDYIQSVVNSTSLRSCRLQSLNTLNTFPRRTGSILTASNFHLIQYVVQILRLSESILCDYTALPVQSFSVVIHHNRHEKTSVRILHDRKADGCRRKAGELSVLTAGQIVLSCCSLFRIIINGMTQGSSR